MGVTKTDHFTDKQNTLAMLFKALGHPARIAIIEYLLKKQECVCGDIVDELPLAQPTISQHLKELKNAGLKATLPRLKVLSLFENSKERHLSAEDIYKVMLMEH